MNAVTQIKVCRDSLLNGLREHMRRTLESSNYTSDDERLMSLNVNYASGRHLYITGAFCFEDDVLCFEGEIVQSKTSIRCHR